MLEMAFRRPDGRDISNAAQMHHDIWIFQLTAATTPAMARARPPKETALVHAAFSVGVGVGREVVVFGWVSLPL